MLLWKLPVTLFFFFFLFPKFKNTSKRFERTFLRQLWYVCFLVLGCDTCIPFSCITSCVRRVSNVCVNYKFKIIFTDIYILHAIVWLERIQSFFSFADCPQGDAFPAFHFLSSAYEKGKTLLTPHSQVLPTDIGCVVHLRIPLIWVCVTSTIWVSSVISSTFLGIFKHLALWNQVKKKKFWIFNSINILLKNALASKNNNSPRSLGS